MKFRNLEKYRRGGSGSTMQLSVPLPKTPDGRVYRYSPNEAAHPRHFVLGDVRAEIEPTDKLKARMKLLPRSQQTVCPYSRTVAADQDFTHPDDMKAAVEMVTHAAFSDMQDEVAKMFEGFNRRQSRNSFIGIEARVDRSRKPKPRFGRRDLMRELVCDHCGRDYGVFAIGLFCPDCGAPNVRLHFAREAELVSAQVALADGLDTAQQELAYRLLGNAHEDVLTAFEATLKAVYLYGMSNQPTGSPPFKPVKNEFQNVEFATKRFAELNFNPFDCLNSAELEALQLNIQKRHIIGHNLGVVDGKFASQAADAKVGETVHLVGEDIRLFATIAQRVIDQLDGWLGGSPSPTIGNAGPVLIEMQSASTVEDPRGLMLLDVELSLLARKVALWIAEKCPNGLGYSIDNDELLSAFAEHDEKEIEEAVAELELEGFVQASHALNTKLPFLSALPSLFAAFDRTARGNDPTLDAVTLAEHVLQGEASVKSESLMESVGWDRRRFNPALAILFSQIDEARVSKALDGGDLVARSFYVAAEDRVALKRFIGRSKS